MRKGHFNYAVLEREDIILIIVLNEKTGESLSYTHECQYPKVWGYDVEDLAEVKRQLKRMFKELE